METTKNISAKYCLNCCASERCKLDEAKRIKLPEVEDKKGCDKVKSTKIEYQLCLTFAIYVDFKSV